MEEPIVNVEQIPHLDVDAANKLTVRSSQETPTIKEIGDESHDISALTISPDCKPVIQR